MTTAERAIRTPDRRVRVFVSSTLVELAEERRAARTAITRMHLTPVMFEIGARAHPARDLNRPRPTCYTSTLSMPPRRSATTTCEGSAYALSGLAGLALAQHRPEVSARLIGASRHALDVIGLAAWSGMQSMNDAQDADVTANLGTRSFARICAEGARMSLPEALTYAIVATAVTPAGSD